MRSRVVGPALFFLSSSLLAFEVVLLRVFSIESFHHFAHMAVGVALLGFGSSGTLLVLLRRYTRGRERCLLAWVLPLTVPAILLAPALARIPRFDPTQLLWDPGQWWGLAAVYGALCLPFLLGAGAVALALQSAGDGVGRVYAWSMAGSGSGAVGVLFLLHRFDPARALTWTVVPAAVAALIVLLAQRRERAPVPESAAGGRMRLAVRRRISLAVACLVALVTVVALGRRPLPLRIIHFKGLPQVEAYPEARRVGEAWDPTGWAVAVDAPAFRHAPGLSLAFRGTLPRQVALFVDGEVVGAVSLGGDSLLRANRGDGREGALATPQDHESRSVADPLAFVEWLPTAAPYSLGSVESVLVLGSGSGLEVSNALRHGALRVTAVELVEPLIRLARNPGGESVSPSVSPYDHSGVSLVIGDVRSYAARSDDRFSLVVLPVSGVFNATAAGIHSGGEDFLNTTEALVAFLALLEPGGTLAVTHWTRTPPRDNLRGILTAATALRASGRTEVGGSLAFVRSWATGTLLVKPDGFTEEEIRDLQRFCRSRFFDLDWPVLEEGEGQEFNRIEEPLFRLAAEGATAGSDAVRTFTDTYPFQLQPSTDDSPYFGHFVRLERLPWLLGKDRAEWLPFAEWGSLGVLATLVQGGLLGLVLMVIPVLALFVMKREDPRPRLLRPGLYFGAIGLGFILIEMAAIQRLSLVLGHPVYAAAGTLGALLIFSGLGSGLSDRLATPAAALACLSVAVVTFLAALLLPATQVLASFPFPARATLALTAVAAVGTVMGTPFPFGLRRLAPGETAVAWGWAANGVASVVGSSLAILLAMETGSRSVLLLGALCYLGAAVASRGRRGHALSGYPL